MRTLVTPIAKQTARPRFEGMFFQHRLGYVDRNAMSNIDASSNCDTILSGCLIVRF